MLLRNHITERYKHDSFFEFAGKKYNLYSIVQLTDKGKLYLNATKKEVIIIEQFTNWNGKLCWKYRFRSSDLTLGIVEYTTDSLPDELIEKVLCEASKNYASRQMYGKSSPVWNVGIRKITPKDWEIPELLLGWMIFIVFIFGTAIFNREWRSVILAAGIMVFFGYRANCKQQHTRFVHDEDQEMLNKTYEILNN